jgi:hypothetical protein
VIILLLFNILCKCVQQPVSPLLLHLRVCSVSTRNSRLVCSRLLEASNIRPFIECYRDRISSPSIHTLNLSSLPHSNHKQLTNSHFPHPLTQNTLSADVADRGRIFTAFYVCVSIHATQCLGDFQFWKSSWNEEFIDVFAEYLELWTMGLDILGCWFSRMREC